MVLESIVSPKDARKNTWKIALLAFVFVSIGIIAADFLGVYTSIIALTLIAIPAVPFIWRLFESEEDEIERTVVLGSRTIARHFPTILIMSMLFIGLIAGFVFWFLVLPSDKTNTVFEVQLNELKAVGASTGQVILSFNNEKFLETFEMLFFHNLGVLLIILFFSLLYGAGAVFVFVWNASIIGVFIGKYALAAAAGASDLSAIIGGIATSALGLFPHGSFELIAYLLGALAGGILSSAITRVVQKSDSFIVVMQDSIKLTAISLICLAIGAFIEAQAIAG
ncbi:MAG: stage II sporulation protein M [Candidatus Micrarchaeota archaeon]